MFKCQKCHLSFQKRFSFVQSARKVAYVNIIFDEQGKSEKKRVDSLGWEIDSEVAVCQGCYHLHNSAQPTLSNGVKHVLNHQYRWRR